MQTSFDAGDAAKAAPSMIGSDRALAGSSLEQNTKRRSDVVSVSSPSTRSPTSAQSVAPSSASPWGYSNYPPVTQYSADHLPPYAVSYPPPPGSHSATWPPPYPYHQTQWQGSSGYHQPPPPALKSPPTTAALTQPIKRELEPSTPSGDPPSYDEAQEALKTLQRYFRHFASSLQPDEKELVQRLNAVKLKPSLPDLPKHSTGTELGAGKRKVKRAKSQYLK